MAPGTARASSATRTGAAGWTTCLRPSRGPTERGLRLHGLLGVRLGALLAAAVASGLPQPVARAVFWQPVVDGQRFVTQFLRLRVAASLMEDRKETVGALRERSQGGETLEVAGYELSPALLEQLDALRLDPAAAVSLGRPHLARGSPRGGRRATGCRAGRGRVLASAAAAGGDWHGRRRAVLDLDRDRAHSGAGRVQRAGFLEAP